MIKWHPLFGITLVREKLGYIFLGSCLLNKGNNLWQGENTQASAGENQQEV
jgi:hypothetical protein